MTPAYVPKIIARHVDHHGGKMTEHLGLVLHVQQGNGSLFHEFSTGVAPNRKSSTWWVSRTGIIEEYVPSTLEAWAQADGNATYNSVETEGFVSEELTLFQLAGLVHLYQLGAEKFKWPYQAVNNVGHRGLGIHSMGGDAWGGHPSCPGSLREHERHTIVTLAQHQSVDPVGTQLRTEVAAFKKHHGLRADPHIGSAVRRLLSID